MALASAVSNSSSCEVVTPDANDVRYASIQSRHCLPRPNQANLRMVLGLVLQDLDPHLFGIPFFPSALVDLVAEYAAPSIHMSQKYTLLQATVAQIPEELQLKEVQLKEFHDEQDLRRWLFNPSVEYTLVAELVIAYFQLPLPEVQQLRVQCAYRSPPKSLVLGVSAPYDVEKYAMRVPLGIRVRAANTMAKLLMEAARCLPEERTATQREIWNSQPLQSRDYLLRRLRGRTLEMLGPFDDAIAQASLVRFAGLDNLFTVTYIDNSTNEIICTSNFGEWGQRLGPYEGDFASNSASQSLTDSQRAHSSAAPPSLETAAATLTSRRRLPITLWPTLAQQYGNEDPPLFEKSQNARYAK